MTIICRLLGHHWGTHLSMIRQREPVNGADWQVVQYVDCLRCNERQAVDMSADAANSENLRVALTHHECEKPMVIFVGKHLPQAADAFEPKDFQHTDGSPLLGGHWENEMVCESCKQGIGLADITASLGFRYELSALVKHHVDSLEEMMACRAEMALEASRLRKASTP